MNSRRDTQSKRTRVPNFSKREKTLLLQLIGDYPIITNLKTDGNTVLEKKKAWEAIVRKYNANSSEYKRNENTLRRAWDNMKAGAKRHKEINHESIDSMSTTNPENEMIQLVAKAYGFKSDPDLVKEISNTDWSVDLCDDGSNTAMKVLSESPSLEETSVKKDIAIQVEEAQANNVGLHTARAKKALKSVRREVALRIRHFKTKKRIKLNILKLKMETQLNKREASRMKREAASLKLAAAKLELQFQQERYM